jgi:Zn-dependent protease with chaperone function
VIIFAFILPSFLIYEPHQSGETITLKLAVVIAIAVSGIAAATFRLFASWWRTRRLLSQWFANSEETSLPDSPIPAFRLDHAFPVFAVVGIRHSRLFISEIVLKTLNQNEIGAVLRHELAHIAALDNLKRLAMQISSDLLVVPIGRSIDKAWSEAAESAADEYAVASGGPSTALDLASALIKIARIIPERSVALPNVSFAVETGEALTARVRRLLQLADGQATPTHSMPVGSAAFIFLAASALAILATDGSLLSQIHGFSEIVLSVLQ